MDKVEFYPLTSTLMSPNKQSFSSNDTFFFSISVISKCCHFLHCYS